MESDEFLEGKTVVVTEKMDGENTTIYSDYYHARSIDSRFHPSRSYLASLAASIGYQIPTDLRICGENLYAKHEIYYDRLEDYFYVHSTWSEGICLSWEKTTELCRKYELKHVPVIYRGIYDKKEIISAYENYKKDKTTEGYVIRHSDAFDSELFQKYVGKFVEPEFRNRISDEHWMHKQMEINGLYIRGK